jgi:hypothetical protein
MRTSAKLIELALYLIRVFKDKNRSLDYAIDQISWYTETDKEEKKVRSLLIKHW